MTDVEKLLPDIVAYLQLTEADLEKEREIRGFIQRGMARLNKIAGKDLDYVTEGQPRSLLFDYCRYANSRALEVFEKNFQSELLDLNLESQVEAHENQNSN